MASLPELDFEFLEDRYSRQRHIASWDQEKLAKARIVVVGAGALGNEVLKNLALAGVGNILIVDFDRIETSNLSRSVLFRDADVGRPKAATAAHALRELNPEISVSAINGDLETDLGLGLLRESDLVLGCLDSIYARWLLNRSCWKAGAPWIDAGINATVGEITLYVPGDGPCYECAMTRQMWRQIHERRSCMLLPRKLPPRIIPTTSVIASVAAALQVNEALAFIHSANRADRLNPGETLFVSTAPYSVSRYATTAKPECLAHETYAPSVFVEASPAEITVSELLDHVPQAVSLQLDFDVLCGWRCVNCGDDQNNDLQNNDLQNNDLQINDLQINDLQIKRLSALRATDITCPDCQAERAPELVHEMGRFDSLANRSLQALGVPSRAILRIKTHTGTSCVELTKSAELLPQTLAYEREVHKT